MEQYASLVICFIFLTVSFGEEGYLLLSKPSTNHSPPPQI